MSDYIERKSIRNMYSCLDPNARVLVGQVLIDIDAIPTIDAVSVVHGKWIKRHGTINCSVCKRSNWSACFEDTVRSFNFCPNCGAKMDGEREGE